MESAVREEQRRLIEPLLGYYFNGCYTQISLNVPHVRLLAGIAVSALILLILTTILTTILIGKHRKKKTRRPVPETPKG